MISIIIPVYNTAPYLDQCIQSVVEQNYKDWECILVDDGSTDNSGTICDKWAGNDSRIRVLHQANQGVSAARNHGIDKSKGDYICFIDSDDWVTANYLSDMLSGLEDKNIDMVVTGVEDVIESGKNMVHSSYRCLKMEMDPADTKDFIEYIDLFYSPYSKLYIAEIIKDNDIKFPVDFSLGEDMIFNLHYLDFVRGICILPCVNYLYRIIGSGTLMTIYRADRFYIEYELWRKRIDFFVSKDMWNSVSRKYMYKELWGILYNGIFSIKHASLSYLREILSIREIDELKVWKDVFCTKKWIKRSILNRAYIILYFARLIR